VLKKKYYVVMNHLRQNSRMALSAMSRQTGISVSTLHDQVKAETGKLFKKFTALLDFEQLGYAAKLSIALAVSADDKEKLSEFLMKNINVNSLYKINNGYDFLAEVVFRQMKDAEEFISELEQNFRIKKKDVHYVLDDLKQETFLSNPHLIY
jgi:DNA-binding Lrp family transcriptional regulator